MKDQTDGCKDALAELVTGAEQIGIHLTARQQDQFVRYCTMLARANASFNLTGARSPTDILRTLFLDSLTIGPFLPGWLTAANAPTHSAVVDVGSGAGVPGIPLKILYPHWTLSLVESIGKKARFLGTAVEELGLEGVSVLPRRAEELGREPRWRDSADLCLARAVAQLPTLLELCAPLVRPGGVLAFPKSGDIEREVSSAAVAARALKTTYSRVAPVPADLGLSEDRVVVLYEKLGPTPPGYPRRTGLAKSKPIGQPARGKPPRGASPGGRRNPTSRRSP